jgi:large repetitive protein
MWAMNEGSGSTLVDSSDAKNNGTLHGSPTWVTGVNGLALRLNGTTGYARVPHHSTLDVSQQMTVAGWVRPEARATQYLVRKGTQNTVDGYELSLANGGTAFVRFNQATSGNTYRIDSTSAYPTNGSTWMHLAATYDGTTMRLYVNGAQQAAAPGPPGGIATNTQPFIVGAQLNTSGTPERFFKGAMDDLHLHNRALSATEIAQLATPDARSPDQPAPGARTHRRPDRRRWNPPRGGTPRQRSRRRRADLQLSPAALPAGPASSTRAMAPARSRSSREPPSRVTMR